MAYDIEVTDINGTAFCSLSAKADSTSLDNITHELNEPSSAELTMSLYDDKFAKWVYRQTWRKYLRIFRDGNIRFWGPITQISPRGEASALVQAQDPLVLLKEKRYFGPTPSVTEFGYPTCVGTGVKVTTEFPSMTGTAVGCTASSSSDTRASGSSSLKLVNADAGEDGFYEYTFDYTTTGDAGYLIFYVPGWFYVGSMTAPAYEERGLYAQCQYPIGTLYDEQWTTLSMSTPTQGWYPTETAVKVPAGPGTVTSRVKVRLYAPQGTVYWDNVNVFMQRSVGSNGGEFIDYGTIIERAVTYLAGLDADAVQLGKSNLNWDISVPACGVTDNHIFDLTSNQNGWEGLSEFVTRNLYDFAVVPNTAGTQWTFYGYTPTKGSFKPKLALELGRNIAESPTLAEDGLQAVNKPRVIGRGSGPSQEVFEDMDTTDLNGLTLESVTTAPADAPISSMRGRAAEQLRLGKAGVEITEVTCKEGAGTQLLSSGLTIGDTVPVKFRYGAINESATRRVLRIVEMPNDLVKIGLNKQ